MPTAPTFYVVPGSAARRAIDEQPCSEFSTPSKRRIVFTRRAMPSILTATFCDTPTGQTPGSSPCRRISAVRSKKAGSSGSRVFRITTPSNLARASAVLILNDGATGYPVACIEAALISSTRTAASAALAAERISPKPFEGTIGVIGTGVIARTTIEWLLFRGWKFQQGQSVRSRP